MRGGVGSPCIDDFMHRAARPSWEKFQNPSDGWKRSCQLIGCLSQDLSKSSTCNFALWKKLNQKVKESWRLRYVKTCHRVPQNIEVQGRGNRLWEQGYRLGIGLWKTGFVVFVSLVLLRHTELPSIPHHILRYALEVGHQVCDARRVVLIVRIKKFDSIILWFWWSARQVDVLFQADWMRESMLSLSPVINLDLFKGR